MPLSWSEIRGRALAFSREWKAADSERSDSQTFWNEFFEIFGVPRKRVAIFERQVRLSRAHEKIKNGRIDAFWKGVLLVEHKSAGQDLDRAFAQAADYFEAVPADRDKPRYILVSNFQNFRLYDLEQGDTKEFELKDLQKNVGLFGFIAGYQIHRPAGPEEAVNIRAATQLGKLHDQLKEVGYEGHQLEMVMVRLLFCLFAEDTGIFDQRNQFRDYLELRTSEDGSDLGMHLISLFQVLNTPAERRQRNLDDQLAAFTYINGRLFEEALAIPTFDSAMRDTLLDACALDWSQISPAIFGSLFQSIMEKGARRDLGGHYTRESNILKAIGPLFLDSLGAELRAIGSSRPKLLEFQKKLTGIKILDPACGCGNFLVIAYRELRRLELELLRRLYRREASSRALDVHSIVYVDVDQLYGIEIEEFPAQIAQVALWMMDHQMNLQVSAEFGQYFVRLPLTKSPNIVNKNALQVVWQDVVRAEELSYIVGNPPFRGKQLQTPAQKAEMKTALVGMRGSGLLDYVAAWYAKATEMMVVNLSIETAFVSTNSIIQGEQVAALWQPLFAKGIVINFAHRTFQWTSEVGGAAAVHCVVIGFSFKNALEKWIFDYDSLRAEPHKSKATHINAYLIDAPDVFLERRRSPICDVPTIAFGSMANEAGADGALLLSDPDKEALLAADPKVERWIRPFMQVEELLYGSKRWCLWLVGISPQELEAMPLVMRRVEAVRKTRSESRRPETRELAKFPTLFGEIRQTNKPYCVVPRHSGEDRDVIPIAAVGPDVICGDANLLIADPSLYLFGVLQSRMHVAWVRVVCGRIKSDFRYSAGIVYNNYPWPDPTEAQRTSIEAAAQAVLDARDQFPGASLAQLYDRTTMPPALAKAHATLDKSVDRAYASSAFSGDAARVRLLFQLYRQITAPIDAAAAPTRVVGRRSRKKSGGESRPLATSS